LSAEIAEPELLAEFVKKPRKLRLIMKNANSVKSCVK
ncbi:hypothetical protein AAUPMC_03384, partial [Pasteurella multocida subsp. multocida str. Anand1_cattle]